MSELCIFTRNKKADTSFGGQPSTGKRESETIELMMSKNKLLRCRSSVVFISELWSVLADRNYVVWLWRHTNVVDNFMETSAETRRNESIASVLCHSKILSEARSLLRLSKSSGVFCLFVCLFAFLSFSVFLKIICKVSYCWDYSKLRCMEYLWL